MRYSYPLHIAQGVERTEYRNVSVIFLENFVIPGSYPEYLENLSELSPILSSQQNKWWIDQKTSLVHYVNIFLKFFSESLIETAYRTPEKLLNCHLSPDVAAV